VQDSITRELILPADPETVWRKSFGSSEALATWFLPIKEGELAPGSTVTFDCGDQVAQARIVEIDPPHKLVWQGHTGGAFLLTDFPESELTTDTFTLEPHPQGTKLTVTESGFSNIPEPRRSQGIKDNERGWDIVLPKMASTYES